MCTRSSSSVMKIELRSLGNGVEQVNNSNCSEGGESSAPWTNEKIRLEKQLISEVRQRPPLWNFKLPLTERGIRTKELLWEEVSIKLNKVMSIKELKKKWKSLCDSFRAYYKKKKASDSEAPSRSVWVHYESLQFLLDLQIQGSTTTNALDVATGDIDETVNDENYELYTNSSINSTDMYASNLSGNYSTNKRRRLDSDHELQDLAEALVRPVTFDQPLQVNMEITKSAVVPEIAHEDSITHFIRFMESDLRGIDDEDARSEVIRRLFEVLFDAKRELANQREYK